MEDAAAVGAHVRFAFFQEFAPKEPQSATFGAAVPWRRDFAGHPYPVWQCRHTAACIPPCELVFFIAASDSTCALTQGDDGFAVASTTC